MTTAFRKAVHVLVYYILPLALLVVSFIFGRRWFFIELGNYALYALIAVMFIKPLYILIPWHFLRHVGTYRRELGLLSFWLFFFHGVGMIYVSNLFSNLGAFLNYRDSLFWGAIAGISMIICGVTSNHLSTRVLGGNWKKVQSFAYLAFIAALIHVGLAKGGSGFILYLTIAGVYVVLRLLAFWKTYREDKAESAEMSVVKTESKPIVKNESGT